MVFFYEEVYSYKVKKKSVEMGKGDFQVPETCPSTDFKQKKTWKRSLSYRVREGRCDSRCPIWASLYRGADPVRPQLPPGVPLRPAASSGAAAAGKLQSGGEGARRRRADVTRVLTSSAAAASKAGWVAGGAEFE